ncbi:MAG: SUMF1/EgtB/PvdO family nonheme iron enzyme [Chloroflexi bacterium]|nr:SUMF1/EgtB/PvdO family nonheme iron enzyme [Chloroflexota bacterium]
MAKFFMTHSWHDIVFVDRLYTDLCAHGLGGFLDKYAIKPGDKISKEIQTGLEACEVYLPVLSHAALKSDWCDEEIQGALTLHNTPGRNHRPQIIPILIEDCRVALQKYSFLLTRLYIDFTQDYDTELEKLLRGLGVTPKPKPAAPPPAEPPTPKPDAPIQTAPPKPVSAPRAPIDLEQTYLDAMEAYHFERWDDAAKKFRAIVAQDPNYEDAAIKLAELERRLQIADLRARGAAAMTAKRWADAAQCWQTLLTLLPNDADATAQFAEADRQLTAQIAEAQRQMQLPELYNLARKSIFTKDWQAARTTLDLISSIDPNYRETKQWMERVTAELWKLAPRTRIGNDGKEMILVPPGEFVMGQVGISDAPPHKVYLDAFYIARQLVTNAEYKKFLDATGHRASQHWSNGQIPAGKENHPVIYVTRDDAVAYCNWAGARLPTEAEWEKAASWDDAKKVKRVYPWGDTFDANKCNSSESKIGDTTPVGKYSPHGDSPYGIADMAGNVWEWCADWYDENYYRNSPARNPTGPDSGQYHGLRGGSWFNLQDGTRSAVRNRYKPGNLYFYIGIRCAE